MSVETIKQNAQSIIEAHKTYSKLTSEAKPDQIRIKKLEKYILNLSSNIKRLIKEERENAI